VSSLKSKNIFDYRTADIADLRIDRPLPCDVYLYFEQNDHLILWQSQDYIFPEGSFEKYLAKGLKKVWVFKDDVPLFEEYLSPALMDPVLEPANDNAPLPDPADVTEITARYLITLLRSAIYSDRQKRALIAKAVRKLLGRAATPRSIETQATENFRLQELVRELLAKINRDDRTLLHQASHQIWKFAETDPSLDHALNVASYSILFAMAFGKIDEELLSEIAAAALMHDVGLSQLTLPIPSLPWNSMNNSEKNLYAQHVPETLGLFSAFLSDIPARVLTLVEQSHECHDGTGYPHRCKGGEIHEAAQIISMADYFDTISSGIWDGTKRTINDAMVILEKHEADAILVGSTRSVHFQPDIFGAITRWIRMAREAA
jgi:HD-GYP domain-containing protein (c-di-GMP phosphodiesterase class II)